MPALNALTRKLTLVIHIAVQMAMYSFQTNPKYWADADKFVPERFLAQQRDGGAAGNPAFAPWGDGQRACVGQRFARAQAKVR